MRAYKVLSFSALTLLIAVLFPGAVTVPAAAQTDTMQFHYNAQHTGDDSPVAGRTQPNGQLKWSYPTGTIGRSSAAIVNGVLYIEDSPTHERLCHRQSISQTHLQHLRA